MSVGGIVSWGPRNGGAVGTDRAAKIGLVRVCAHRVLVVGVLLGVEAHADEDVPPESQPNPDFLLIGESELHRGSRGAGL